MNIKYNKHNDIILKSTNSYDVYNYLDCYYNKDNVTIILCRQKLKQQLCDFRYITRINNVFLYTNSIGYLRCPAIYNNRTAGIVVVILTLIRGEVYYVLVKDVGKNNMNCVQGSKMYKNDVYETYLECAKRECYEETGI